MGAGVRLIIDGGEVYLMTLAAQQAWWDLSLTQLQGIASFAGIPFAKHSNLFDTLSSRTAHVLSASLEEVLKVLRRRLVSLQSDTTIDCADEVLQLEEATKVLEPSDEQTVQSEKKQATAAKESFRNFAGQYRQKAAEVRAAAKAQAEAGA